MSFVQNFSITQSSTTPAELTITDTSTGTGTGIINRRIYLQTASGEYLVEDGTSTDYEVWSYSAGSSITLDVLDQDYALSVRLDWVDGSGTVLYTKTTLYGFTVYSEQFNYELIQDLSADPNRLNDQQYLSNVYRFRVLLDSVDNAVTYGNDIFAAQRLLDAVKDMMDNETPYFS